MQELTDEQYSALVELCLDNPRISHKQLKAAGLFRTAALSLLYDELDSITESEAKHAAKTRSLKRTLYRRIAKSIPISSRYIPSQLVTYKQYLCILYDRDMFINIVDITGLLHGNYDYLYRVMRNLGIPTGWRKRISIAEYESIISHPGIQRQMSAPTFATVSHKSGSGIGGGADVSSHANNA